jgi:hypothetical protein
VAVNHELEAHVGAELEACRQAGGRAGGPGRQAGRQASSEQGGQGDPRRGGCE